MCSHACPQGNKNSLLLQEKKCNLRGLTYLSSHGIILLNLHTNYA